MRENEPPRWARRIIDASLLVMVALAVLLVVLGTLAITGHLGITLP